jgi:hypothetical protein
MDSLPIWAIWSTIPGVVVLAPVLAFLLATATVIIIGLLKEVAVPAVLAFTAAGISGWLLARKARARSRSLSVVTAVESGSLGGMTRAAVGNVTPFPHQPHGGELPARRPDREKRGPGPTGINPAY